MIISPKKFERALQPLVCHKEKHGIPTYLATLDEVYEKMYWQGRDQAEKIKYYIKNAIENWGIEYVLLVGGKNGQSKNWNLPARYINLANDYEAYILSDLYFADIYDNDGNFSSWDPDMDGVYAEWLIGEQPEDNYIDIHPDIAVGRLATRNVLEVKIVVEKIINYENTAYNKSWFKNMVAIAGDTYPQVLNNKWVGYEGEYDTDRAFENMTGFNQIKLYSSQGNLTLKNIIKFISNGCGFVYFSGHGSAISWSTHLPNSTAWTDSLITYNMISLKNYKKLPICVIGGCHNLQFDVTVFNLFNKTRLGRGEAVFECGGEWMTRKIGGGSVATLGSTALGHTKEDKISFTGGTDQIELEFFRQYRKENVDIIGDAWKNAINLYVDTYPVNWVDDPTNDSWVDFQIPSTWMLMGDPTLKIGGYPPN